MNVDVVLLPEHLETRHQVERAVVVFDVLRATTSMAAALAAGVSEIRVFRDLESARSAAAAHDGARLLCGERNCLPPPGFDLGNSPGAFDRRHAGHTLFMSTTNGTRAIGAITGAAEVFVGAVNAGGVAQRLRQLGRDVTLLCAGTNGAVAMEDLLGAGAVLDALDCPSASLGDLSQIAWRLFQQARGDLEGALRLSRGGQNVLAAGLAEDITFCANLNCLDLVGRVLPDPLRVVRA